MSGVGMENTLVLIRIFSYWLLTGTYSLMTCQASSLNTQNSSENLVKIAAQHPKHVSIVADNLALPHPSSFFDFAISIAVVHHLSTHARRVSSIAAILETLRPDCRTEEDCNPAGNNDGGKCLIYVWALEQKSSRRGWDEGDEQDVMVPWVMKQKTSEGGNDETKTFHRYYHLYRRDELEQDIAEAGGTVVESGFEKDNWWAIAIRQFPSQAGA